VLANGTSDLANRLGVRGENKSLSWLKYELPSLENAIKSVKNEEKVNSKPVLIVGAGLSAADAVIACRNSGIKVIHVFRSLTGGFVSYFFFLYTISSHFFNLLGFFSYFYLLGIFYTHSLIHNVSFFSFFR
jgi:hypothetical protein